MLLVIGIWKIYSSSQAQRKVGKTFFAVGGEICEAKNQDQLFKKTPRKSKKAGETI